MTTRAQHCEFFYESHRNTPAPSEPAAPHPTPGRLTMTTPTGAGGRGEPRGGQKKARPLSEQTAAGTQGGWAPCGPGSRHGRTGLPRQQAANASSTGQAESREPGPPAPAESGSAFQARSFFSRYFATCSFHPDAKVTQTPKSPNTRVLPPSLSRAEPPTQHLHNVGDMG